MGGESSVSESGDDIWRKRFQLFMLARLFGVVTFLFGIAIAYTNLVRPGGWPLVGGLITIAGAIDAVFAPRLLRKMWQQEDLAAGRPGDEPTQRP
jgi:hypothetical protein